GACDEDPQDHGHGDRGGCSAGVVERRRWRPYPGRRFCPRGVWRDLPAEHAGVGCDPADQRDAGPVCGRRGLQSGAHGLCVHGA
ncbi:hypothetical protein ADK54_17755, partial [Streptomyces sp. WM6378]